MSDDQMTPFAKRKQDFSEAKSLEEAAKLVWERPAGEDESALTGKDQHPGGAGMYQHYTTLSRVLEKIITRRWYLTRGDSMKLNDIKEPKKYGCDNEALMRRTYITCFGNGAGENVAMWGLYAHKDPLAIRVSIPLQTVDQWMRSLMEGANPVAQSKQRHDINPAKLESSIFRDIIYVAVQDKEVLDDWDIRRTDTISWEGVKRKFSPEFNLKREIRKTEYAGWLKDYEWFHEREARLCIRLKKEITDDSISIAIPEYVLSDMRFTFSPWLEDEGIQASIQATITAALESTGTETDKRTQRFRRSVLQGALNLNL